MRHYFSPVWLSCFENEGEGQGTEGGEGQGGQSSQGGEGGEGQGQGEGEGQEGQGSKVGDGKVFRSQAEVNAYLAADRRKTEQKFKAQMKAELEKQEKIYNQLLTNTSLTEQERDSLRESLAGVEQKLHSETDRLRKEKKDLEDAHKAKTTELEKKVSEWENRYKETTIKRELQEAAIKHEAFNSHQMVTALRPYTKLVEVEGNFQVLVDLEDMVDGKPKVTTLSPDEALKRMRELPELYGNLFKANVNSGVGGSGSGVSNAKIDPKHLTQEQYREFRKKALA